MNIATQLMLSCLLLCADNPEFKRRIVTALGLLVGAKLLTVQVGLLTHLWCDSAL